MKKLIFLITLFISSAFSVAAQSPCPTISVYGPDRLIPIGENMTFTSKIEGFDLSKVGYKWSVTGGKIVSGENTSVLTATLLPDMLGMTTTATVEISGLPAGCPYIASTSEIICHPRHPENKLIDEFSVNVSYLPKDKLESLKTELSNDSTAKNYIIEKFKHGTPQEFIKKRIADIYLFFYENSLISSEQIVVQIFYDNKNLTQFWIVPDGAEAPNKDVEKIEIEGKNYQKKLDEMFPKAKSNSVRKRN